MREGSFILLVTMATLFGTLIKEGGWAIGMLFISWCRETGYITSRPPVAGYVLVL